MLMGAFFEPMLEMALGGSVYVVGFLNSSEISYLDIPFCWDQVLRMFGNLKLLFFMGILYNELLN